MSRSAIFGILGALVLAIFIGYFGSGSVVMENLPPHTASTTGLATLPTPILPSITLPKISTTTTATTSVATVPKAAKAPAAVPVQPAPTPATPQAPVGNISISAVEIRAALVNIICEAPANSGLESISGSGVIIDPRGVILTNAHIGQYFLLANRGVSCVVRTGSPAEDAYDASLAFISPAWVNANSAVVTEQSPTGTGEYDIAILAINQSATAAPLPTSFSYVPLAEDAPVLNEPVVIGSYAAQFLQPSSIEDDLYPTIVYGSVQQLFTFAVNTADIVSLGGSAAAQEGSSGGGVVDAAGNLTATITTSSTQGNTSTRELNALTESYIRRDYAEETGYALATLLSENLYTMVANFAPQIPALEAEITAHLPN